MSQEWGSGRGIYMCLYRHERQQMEDVNYWILDARLDSLAWSAVMHPIIDRRRSDLRRIDAATVSIFAERSEMHA